MDVRLEPWCEAGLAVLRRANTPEMMTYLGGPESAEQVLDRHRRYLALGEPGAGRMFLVCVDDQLVGVVGYWEHEWQGEPAYEAGWSVLPAWQGHGIAVAALTLVIEHARAQGGHQTLRAFPSIHNGASKAVCGKAGMVCSGACDFEYPRGNPMRCNDWYLRL